MAKSQSLVGVVESLERLEDTQKGWGKYKVQLEGYEDEIRVAVPADLNEKYDLEEGLELKLSKGPFKDWIVTTPTFEEGGYYEEEDEAPAPKKKSTTRSKRTTSRAKKETSNEAPAKKRTSTSYDDWNQYQINKRDPKMEQQDYLKLVKDVYICVLSNDLEDNPDDIVDDIIAKAKDMFNQMQ